MLLPALSSEASNEDMAWSERLVKRLGLLSETSLWQAGVAALGFASGIAIVRLLDVEEYAIYTIANSLLGALAILGDSGISSGVMSQGGSVWKDRYRLGAVVNTALLVSRWFALAAALIAIPAGLFLLARHGAPLGISLGVAAILIPCFILSIRNTILQIPIKLHQDLRPLQSIQLGSNTVRLLLLGVVLPFAPYAIVALGAAALSTAYANLHISRRSNLYMDAMAPRDPAAHKEIMRLVWRMLPGSTYYCIQGQLTIWLISIFGNTTAVAQLGALGRLGMVTSIVAAVATTLVVPRFARLPGVRHLLLRRLFVILISLVIICCFGLGVVALFPEAFLWILGSSYSGLHEELILMSISSALSLLMGTLVSLCFSRGLIPNPVMAIPYGILVQVVFISLNDMSTAGGVLMMSVGVSAAGLLFFAVYSFTQLGRASSIKLSA
jgi:O-antigen/teichoic acid export membrane protein